MNIEFDYKNNRRNLYGFTPPSIFVGSSNYPIVKIGPVITTTIKDIELKGNIEKWSKINYSTLLNLRSSMIRCYGYNKTYETGTKLVSDLQEILLYESYSALNLDIGKYKRSNLTSNNFNKIENPDMPFGYTLPIERFDKLSPVRNTTNNKIEKVFYDNDLDSKSAIIDLYFNNVRIDKIQSIFSIGMTGKKNNRRIIPTKWSITATDKIISDYLINKIKVNRPVDKVSMYKYEHYNNYYCIIITPSETWSMEYFEIWINGEKKYNKVISDFENEREKKTIPNTAGAFFAARLSVAEFLHKIKKIGSVVIFRVIYPLYNIPLGVWQVRLGMRYALADQIDKKGKQNELECSLEEIDNFVPGSSSLNRLLHDLIIKSKTSRLKKQLKLSSFFKINDER